MYEQDRASLIVHFKHAKPHFNINVYLIGLYNGNFENEQHKEKKKIYRTLQIDKAIWIHYNASSRPIQIENATVFVEYVVAFSERVKSNDHMETSL